MSQNWIRKYALTVNGEVLPSSLRIRFYIYPNKLSTPDSAEIRIYNLTKDHAHALSKTEGKEIQLQAGYMDNCGVIYYGEIIRAMTGRENEVDTFIDFFCRAGDGAHNWGVVNKTLAAGSTQNDIVNELLKAISPYGITRGNIQSLSSYRYPRAVTLFGMARSLLSNIAKTNGSTWYVKDQKLNIEPWDATTGRNFILNENTGMVGIPQETQDGVVVTSLINPQMRVGDQVTIDESKINRAPWIPNWEAEKQSGLINLSGVADGTYIIQGMEYRGDGISGFAIGDAGDEWYQTMFAYGAKTGGSLGHFTAGLGRDGG